MGVLTLRARSQFTLPRSESVICVSNEGETTHEVYATVRSLIESYAPVAVVNINSLRQCRAFAPTTSTTMSQTTKAKKQRRQVQTDTIEEVKAI